MEVSIVVPTFRRPDALAETLAALAAVDFPAEQYEVIVVDDGPDETTRAVTENAGGASASVRYVPQTNSGVATARNRGASLARGDLLIFLDDDMLVERDHLTRHLTVQKAHGPCLLNGHWEFAPAVRHELEETPFGRFRIKVEDWVKTGIEKRPGPGGLIAPSGVTAANLSISRADFDGLGGFDEDFPHAGSEDQELSRRAVDAGKLLLYDESIRLLHNDRRVDLRLFGERQEQGALTAVYLASKHPAEWQRPMIAENMPLSRADPPGWLLKKLAKKALSNDLALGLIMRSTRVLERVRPATRLLPRLYWAICGLYIFRGVRRGLEEI